MKGKRPAAKAPVRGSFLNQRSDLLAYGYSCLYALAAVIVSFRLPPIGDLNTDTDFYGDLVYAAQALTHGHFSVENYPYKGPLYSFVLSAAYPITHDWYRAATLVSAIPAFVALAGIYRLVATVFSSRVALVTVVATSLTQDFFLHSYHATTDQLFLALAIWSCVLFCSTASLRRRRGLAGALAGFAFLTRYNGAALAIAAIVADLFVGDGVEKHDSPPREAHRRRDRWQATAWFLGTFLLVTGPWFIANLSATGRLLPRRNVQNLIAGLYGDARWSQSQAGRDGDLLSLVREAPLHAVTQYALNLREHLASDFSLLLGWPLAIVALAGILGLFVRPPARRTVQYLCFPAAYFLAMGAIFWTSRFSFFLLPAYLGMGFSTLLGSPGRSFAPWVPLRARSVLDAIVGRYSAIAAAGLLCAAAALRLPALVAQEREFRSEQPLYLLPAAASLQGHASRGGRNGTDPPLLMARKGHLALLAGFRYQQYPIAAASSLDDLERFAREHGVRYIAYGEAEFALVPFLRFLAIADSVPGLDVVYAGPRLRVFELRNESAEKVANDAETLAMLHAALRIAEAYGETDVQSATLGKIAAFYQAHGDMAAAEVALRRILVVCAATPAPHDLEDLNAAIGRYLLAKLLLASGRASEAAAEADTSAAYFEQHGQPAWAARAYLVGGMCQEALGSPMEAAKRTARAQALDPTAGIDH